MEGLGMSHTYRYCGLSANGALKCAFIVELANDAAALAYGNAMVKGDAARLEIWRGETLIHVQADPLPN